MPGHGRTRRRWPLRASSPAGAGPGSVAGRGRSSPVHAVRDPHARSRAWCRGMASSPKWGGAYSGRAIATSSLPMSSQADGGDDVLSAVDHVGHRRAGGAARQLDLPHHLAGRPCRRPGTSCRRGPFHHCGSVATPVLPPSPRKTRDFVTSTDARPPWPSHGRSRSPQRRVVPRPFAVGGPARRCRPAFRSMAGEAAVGRALKHREPLRADQRGVPLTDQPHVGARVARTG